MEAVDVKHSLGLCEDQAVHQYGLQSQQNTTSFTSSSVCTVTPEHWNTLRWEEPTGVANAEMKLWDNVQMKGSSPQELWKYCRRNFHMQLHVTAPQEVETLNRYAHDRV